MTSKCPSCKTVINETGWSTEEIDVEHHTGIKARSCNAISESILAVFRK